MLENKLITDLLSLINGVNNHVTVELTYTSCAYSTNDEIHESNVSANRIGTKKRQCLEIPGLPVSLPVSNSAQNLQNIFASSVINLHYLPLIST